LTVVRGSPRFGRMTRGSTRLRALGGAVVVYLVLGVPVARVWHEATAAHRYCPEHHAMEEASGPSSSGHPGPAGDPGGKGREHEACPFTPLGGQSAAAPAQAEMARPLPAACAREALPDLADPAVRVGVLSLAPKTSPPA